MLHFSYGPLACMKFDVGGVMEQAMSIPTLVAQYIRHRQIDEAINLLVSLNWNEDGFVAMQCLNSILNYLLKIPLTPQCESQIEACLGTFHVPIQPLTRQAEDEFGPTVRALTRRFFFKISR